MHIQKRSVHTLTTLDIILFTGCTLSHEIQNNCSLTTSKQNEK